MKSILLLLLLNTSLNADSSIVAFKPDIDSIIPQQNQITLEELKGHIEKVNQKEKPFIPINTEILPEFPGGDSIMQQFVKRHAKYPKLALENKAEGEITISFAVMKDRKIPDKHIKIVKGIDEDCNNEVIRIIKKMPKWISGRKEGYPLPMYVTLVFSFSILDDGSSAINVRREKNIAI